MFKPVKAIIAVTLVNLLVVAGGSAAFAAPEMILKFAGQNSVDHPASKQMEAIAKEIAEKTDGRIEVKVYPANQLGDYSLVLIYINGFVGDYDDVKKVFASDGWMFKKMDEFNSRLGVKLLGFFVEGMIGTGTTKPANDPLNPAVDKDVLIRVPNMDVYKLAAEAMGYRTVTIPYADVYQAIQTGVVPQVLVHDQLLS